MEADEERREVAAYRGAVEAVFALAVGASLGYWADSHSGTSPRWLIVGTVVGFGVFALRLWRMRKLVDEEPPAGRTAKR